MPFKIYTYLWTTIAVVRSAYPRGFRRSSVRHDFSDRNARIYVVCVCIAWCFLLRWQSPHYSYSTPMPRLYGTPSRTGSDHIFKSGAARCAHTPRSDLIPAVLLLHCCSGGSIGLPRLVPRGKLLMLKVSVNPNCLWIVNEQKPHIGKAGCESGRARWARFPTQNCSIPQKYLLCQVLFVMYGPPVGGPI